MIQFLTWTLSLIFNQFGLIIISLLGLLYYFITKNHDYFSKRGIRYEKPVFLFGTQKKFAMRQSTLQKLYNEIYEKK